MDKNLVDRIFRWSFALTVLSVALYALLKLLHKPNADLYWNIGYLPWLVFIVSGSYEVWRFQAFPKQQKWMFTIGFIFLSVLAGAIYIMRFRNRR
jgi:hypothetical protein